VKESEQLAVSSEGGKQVSGSQLKAVKESKQRAWHRKDSDEVNN